jgi:hypothetical protein
VQVIDRAIGGGAARADLGVDPQGRCPRDLAAVRRRPCRRCNGGQALLGWIQAEESTNRVKALLQPLGLGRK